MNFFLDVSESRHDTREQLLLAGIEEINRHSLANFSMRRVAAACGLSCAAPYKHFKDRQDFIAAIIDYVNAQWQGIQQQLLEVHTNSVREQLVEFSVNYVKFLVENPSFRSILMMSDDAFDNTYHHCLRGEMTALTQRLVQRYCDEVGMPEPMRTRKLYVVRALIYGAALMFDNHEMEYDTQNLEYVRYNINREFDLP